MENASWSQNSSEKKQWRRFTQDTKEYRDVDSVQTSVWWPGLSHELNNVVKQCHTCAREFTPRRQPMIPTQLPDYPWQKVGTDLFHFKGANYLLVVDYFSRYPEIVKPTNTTSQNIIDALKNIFSRYGIPEIVMSDNGPQYSSQEFADFAKNYDFHHKTSSPHFAQFG